jgi:hypothetical protein
MLENQLLVRDILSQETTGKDLDYLQLNQTHDQPTVKKDFSKLLEDAGMRALGGGLPGALAMAAQVTLLMWIRTVMNYQYRHGMQTWEAMRVLYQQGGLPRFYRGYLPALIQGPMARFGDTAANSGVLSLLDSMDSTKNWPVSFKTVFASGAAAAYRILLMPVDTVKTIMQVEGQHGFSILVAKMRKSGPSTLFHGAIGASVATFVGHYPWFFTFNYLNANLPPAPKENMWLKLARNAVIGFCSSAVSDTISNSMRVIKTTKQTAEHSISYRQAASLVIDKDGIQGLFGRGLKTRIVANGMQGMLFTIIWKGLEDKWKETQDAKKKVS